MLKWEQEPPGGTHRRIEFYPPPAEGRSTANGTNSLLNFDEYSSGSFCIIARDWRGRVLYCHLPVIFVVVCSVVGDAARSWWGIRSLNNGSGVGESVFEAIQPSLAGHHSRLPCSRQQVGWRSYLACWWFILNEISCLNGLVRPREHQQRSQGRSLRTRSFCCTTLWVIYTRSRSPIPSKAVCSPLQFSYSLSHLSPSLSCNGLPGLTRTLHGVHSVVGHERLPCHCA